MGTQKNLSPPSTMDGVRAGHDGLPHQVCTICWGERGVGAGGGVGVWKRFQCHLSAFCGKPRSLEGLLRPGRIS